MMKKIALALLLAFTLLPAAITAMKVTTTSGPPAAGSVHPMNTSVGLRTGGFTGAIIMSCRKDTGGRLHFQSKEKRGSRPAFLLLRSCPAAIEIYNPVTLRT